MKLNSPHLSILVAAVLSGHTEAAITFTSGTEGWHRYGSATLLSTASDATFGTGNSLQIPAGTTAAIYNFSGVTLGLGESLSIAFDFHFVGSAGTQGPRLFFGNQGNPSANVATDADTSYYTGIGTSSPSNSNYVFNGGTGAGVSIAGSGNTLPMVGTGTLAINDVNSHHIVYTITRNNGYYDFLTTITDADGVSNLQQKSLSGSGVAAAATSNLTTFNTVGLLQGASGGSSYAIDNVSIVPEPSAVLLGGLGALGLLRRRRA